jgi:hypothetical protein
MQKPATRASPAAPGAGAFPIFNCIAPAKCLSDNLWPGNWRLEACRHIFGQAPIERGLAVKIFAVFAFLCGKSFRRFFGGRQKRR